jgi:hypothetical protein
MYAIMRVVAGGKKGMPALSAAESEEWQNR